MINRRSLSAIRKKAEELKHLALVHWYVTEDDPGPFVNLRNIRLLVLIDSTVHIMPGTIIRDGDGDQSMLFASKGLCRIRNGRRNGMIVEPQRLRVGEDANATGLIKPLTSSSKSNSFHMSDERDRQLVERIHSAYADAFELEAVIPPTAYIRTRQPEDLTIRLSGDITKMLMDLDEYDKELPMEDNFENLIGQFAIAHKPKGTKLYPFDMVAGNGLVMVDVENLPPALLVAKDALQQEHKHMRIRLC